ncbi:hypothetical protein Lesp02_56470 [Lentzea sp. NBRC 105346]|nr:hypothetical protein Lesp02_56470 [Lentzea sp. NBRC 105346]
MLVLALLAAGCAVPPDIRLRVEGTGTTDQLTYVFPGQEEKTLRNPDMPWERSGAKHGKVSLRLEGVHGTLTCKIIINGRQVRAETSSSGEAVNCTHVMAD